MALPVHEILRGIRRHGRGPAIMVVVVAVVALVLSFVLPKWYRARATVMPPEQAAEGFGLLASLIEGSALSKVGLVSTSSPSDLYAEILESRRVRESLIEEFDLKRRFREDNLDLCLRVLDKRVRVNVLTSRIIEVQVEDRDPEMAARMANALLAKLDEVNQNIHSQRAEGTARFLADQLRHAERELREAEATLTQYERQHGVVAGADEAAVRGAADLISRKLALQVRRSWMQSYVDRNSPTLKALDSELNALEGEIARLPSLKQQAARLALDVEIQRRVYTLVTAQLQEARIRQQSTVPTVSVLDPARAPTLHAKPRKLFVVGASFAAAFLLAAAWVLWRTRRDLAEGGRLPD